MGPGYLTQTPVTTIVKRAASREETTSQCGDILAPLIERREPDDAVPQSESYSLRQDAAGHEHVWRVRKVNDQAGNRVLAPTVRGRTTRPTNGVEDQSLGGRSKQLEVFKHQCSAAGLLEQPPVLLEPIGHRAYKLTTQPTPFVDQL